MSNFFFNRQPTQTRSRDDLLGGGRTDNGRPDEAMPDTLRAVVEAQSITDSAIFAMLVSKGILPADEAAEYMREIGAVLGRDVAAPAGPLAGQMLASYGEALIAAGG